jgi:transposase
MQVLTDEQWSVLEPLLAAVRPRAPQPIRRFRRTIEAIVWRLQNGAKWRAIPAELGPWWMAAQTFIRWSRLGVWERLHQLAQKRQPPELGLVFLDGTVIRAHQKAAGAKGGAWCRRRTPRLRPLAAPAAVTGPKRMRSPMPAAERSRSR